VRKGGKERRGDVPTWGKKKRRHSLSPSGGRREKGFRRKESVGGKKKLPEEKEKKRKKNPCLRLYRTGKRGEGAARLLSAEEEETNMKRRAVDRATWAYARKEKKKNNLGRKQREKGTMFARSTHSPSAAPGKSEGGGKEKVAERIERKKNDLLPLDTREKKKKKGKEDGRALKNREGRKKKKKKKGGRSRFTFCLRGKKKKEGKTKGNAPAYTRGNQKKKKKRSHPEVPASSKEKGKKRSPALLCRGGEGKKKGKP